MRTTGRIVPASMFVHYLHIRTTMDIREKDMKEKTGKRLDSSDIFMAILDLVMLIALVMDFVHGDIMNGFIGIIAIVLCTFFHVMWRKFGKDLLPQGIYIFGIIFVSIAVFWSNHLSLYTTFFFHDILLHFASGVLVVMLLAYLVPKRILSSMTLTERIILFMVSAVAVAGFWEIIEFFTDMIMHSDVQRNTMREWEIFSTTWQNPAIIDSMNDMINGTFGGALGCLIYGIRERKARKNR